MKHREKKISLIQCCLHANRLQNIRVFEVKQSLAIMQSTWRSFWFLPIPTEKCCIKIAKAFLSWIFICNGIETFCTLYLGHHPWHNFKSRAHNLPGQGSESAGWDLYNVMKDSYFPKTGCLLTPHLIENNVEPVLESGWFSNPIIYSKGWHIILYLITPYWGTEGWKSQIAFCVLLFKGGDHNSP